MANDKAVNKPTNLGPRILLGLGLGILAGVFFGEYCTVLRPAGGIYIMLLQAPVYPYLICSVIRGVAALSPTVSLQLLSRAWPMLLLTWGAALAVLLVVGQAIPISTPRLIDADAAKSAAQVNLLQMLIPVNIDEAIVKNYIPAVVIFGLVFGAALQGYPKKKGLLDILEMIAGASQKLWLWLLPFAPIGIFALVADTAGSFPVDALGQLFLYVVLSYLSAILIAFWLLPALLSALTPVRYGEFLADMKAPLLLAMGTCMPVVAVPYIQEIARKLARQSGIDSEESEEIIETATSVSFVLGQVSNFFLYLLILFAAYHFHHALDLTQREVLPLITLFASLGTASLLNAVIFLSSWLGLPAETSSLYVQLRIMTNFAMVPVSVMGMAFLSILATLAYYRRVQFRAGRLFAYLMPFVIACVGLTLGAHAFSRSENTATQSPLVSFALSEADKGSVKVVETRVDGTEAHWPSAGEDALDRILRTGILRVGMNTDRAPFCYLNDQQQLAGFDVAAAYELAKVLNCKLEFLRWEGSKLVRDLELGRYDIAMSGIMPDREMVDKLAMPQPYLLDRFALVVPATETSQFLDMKTLGERQDLRMVSFKNAIPEHLARVWFPKADLQFVEEPEFQLDAHRWDALLAPLYRAEAIVSMNAGYTVVVPLGLSGRLPLVYPISRDSPRFRQVVDIWLDANRASGFFTRQENHWLREQPLADQTPRWSILRNVLHWGR